MNWEFTFRIDKKQSERKNGVAMQCDKEGAKGGGI